MESPSEVRHLYGPRVHLHEQPFLAGLLQRASTASCGRLELIQTIRTLYTVLAARAFGATWPTSLVERETRMAEFEPAAATLRAEVLDPALQVVVVDVIRGGILPSQLCFELLSAALPEDHVRQDHLNLARTTDENNAVTGADLSGSKVGGPIDGRWLVLPDPMGATGSTTVEVIRHYREQHGKPAGVLCLPLISTPEFLRRVLGEVEDVTIHTLRVDRGLSEPDVLNAIPGQHWERERGLTATGYIVPGAGGLGELLNNSWC